MKRLIVGVSLMLLVLPLISQEIAETEDLTIHEMVIGTVPVVDTQWVPDDDFYVRALCVGLANFFPDQADWAILDFATLWRSNQDWYMLFIVVNPTSRSRNIKVEFELMWNNGGGRFYRKQAKNIGSGNIVLYWLNVKSKVNKLGVFTCNGRVFGAGVGNNNRVQSQVYIY